jgi:hypothetical protein
VPLFHCLCLVFLSLGHVSPPSCMPMPPSSAQLSFVFTLPHHSCPFCLHCLGSSSKFFWSSPDPKVSHRGSTGDPTFPLPSPTLRSYFPDISLCQLQRCFCLIFFRLKKFIPKESYKEGRPRLVTPPSSLVMAHRHPPHPFASVSVLKWSCIITHSSHFSTFQEDFKARNSR